MTPTPWPDRRDLLDLTVREVITLLDAAMRRPAVVPADPPPAPAEWLDTAAAAAYLGCSTRILRIAAAAGEITHARIGRGGRRFRRAALDAWAERASAPEPGR